MENPYTTESLSNIPNSKTWDLKKVWIALVPVSVIAANYATATTIPRELWDVFAQVVFLLAPVSFLIHLPNLVPRSREPSPSKAHWWKVTLLLIPGSFLLSLSPYFSRNPNEAFVVWNRFFGPYGWMLWAWLLVLGILPLLELNSAIQQSRWTMKLLSWIVIGFHIHNAYWIWLICHIPV